MPSESTASESAIIERPCPAVRDRLLNVALQLFAQKGFESTSIREIASAAEVTKPTIYYYFKSKEGLYLELANYLYETVENEVLLSSVPGETARIRIKSFILKILNSISENSDNRKFILILVKGTRQDIISNFHLRVVDLIKNKLCDILVNGINSGELFIDDIEDVVRSLLSYILLCIYDNIYINPTKTNIKEVEMMLDKLLNQIAP
jgi:AcrR family transcriptional regulator